MVRCGDERFHPDNIIWDARESNIIAIIDKDRKSYLKLGLITIPARN